MYISIALTEVTIIVNRVNGQTVKLCAGGVVCKCTYMLPHLSDVSFKGLRNVFSMSLN